MGRQFVVTNNGPSNCDDIDLWGVCSILLNEVDVAYITGGQTFFVALTCSGQIITWGSACSGELGRLKAGPAFFRAPPEYISNLNDVRQVACGNQHVITLTSTGSCFAWGSNRMGQLGIDANDNLWTSVPVRVRKVPNDCKKVAAGKMHTFALDYKFQIWSWGSNSHGQLGRVATEMRDCCLPHTIRLNGSDNHAIDISGGGYHSALVTQQGRVYTFGCGLYQQLGRDRFDTHDTSVPTLVESLLRVGKVLEAPSGKFSGIRSVECGEWHTAALTTNGDLYTFGWNLHLQLGQPRSCKGSDLPLLVTAYGYFDSGIEDRKVERIKCGTRSTSAQCKSGKCFVFGNNIGTNVGIKVLGSEATKFKCIGCSSWSTIGIL